MKRITLVLGAVVLTGAIVEQAGLAQDFKPKPPTAADWAALGRLPDFNGVWEAGGGGRGAPAPAGVAGGARAGTAAGAGGRAGAAAPAGPAAGAAARGRAGGPAGPALTSQDAAKRKTLQDAAREDKQTANCLPQRMPRINGQ